MKEELLKKLDEILKELEEDQKNVRSEAYGVRIVDQGAIELRDRFNQNAGKYEMLMIIRSKIEELKDNKKEEKKEDKK